MRTIERFHEYSPELNIILVLPESQQEYWHQLCQEHHFSIKHQIANGGDTRFQSSKNGLALVPDTEDGVVGFHDGVRPFVSTEVIDECYETAREEYAAIPVYAVTDTLRYIDQHGGGKNVLRSDYRVVQTPQAFDIGLAKQAFNQEYKEQFTDDASVVESLGCQVAMVDGNRENIKITTPFDIKIAEALYINSPPAQAQARYQQARPPFQAIPSPVPHIKTITNMSSILDQDIQFLPSVGPKTKEILSKELGIRSYGDLLEYYPYKYVDRSKIFHISELTSDMPFVQLKGKIPSYEEVDIGKRNKMLVAHFS